MNTSTLTVYDTGFNIGIRRISPAVNVALTGRIKVIGINTYHPAQTEVR